MRVAQPLWTPNGRPSALRLLLIFPQFASISIVATASEFVPKSTAMKMMSLTNPTGWKPLVWSLQRSWPTTMNLVGLPCPVQAVPSQKDLEVIF